ncbi:MAG: TonB-dependent receptor [Candidatus Eremiobacteraeota bacterium]|nr:TonB-dependent receptor [Candidatus Eremiobacteraeota bacterium]
MKLRSFRAVSAAVLSVFAVLMPLGRASAGTTGAIVGSVADSATRAPVAGATVTVASPSQVARVTTDASGHFAFLSLAPDTYTLSAEKTGYESLSIAGVAVFADQTQSIPLALQKSLKQIAHVTSRSSLSQVRAGTGTDVYSVNPALTSAASPLGGGGGLNNAYSAIASMPGAYVPPNQVGVNQTVYIRGGYYDQIGYEYDGIPVNRSFDNYPASSESTLGQQELQIYTGGGEADANATGLGGFINQVIKTGTFPGYAIGGLAVGSPTFYHDARVEVGGATPDRLFSYYAGISGTNQDFRYFDQFNGASLTDTIPYGYYPSYVTTFLPFFPAVYPTCHFDTTYANPATKFLTSDPGCFGSFTSSYGQPASVDGRDVVANVHVGVPHRRDSGRDDVQLLFMSSANFQQDYSSVNDAGPLGLGLVNSGLLNHPSDIYSGLTNQWPDYYTYPSGTPWLAPASTAPIAYFYPGSPSPRCANVQNVAGACPLDAHGNQEQVLIPNDYRDGRWDTAGIAKLQYQKNVGSTAYVRLFGYTFYSYTNRATANGWGNNAAFGVSNYQYEVSSHTRGLELQFADQIASQHLVSGMVSYLTSNTLRYFNHNYFNTASQQVSNFTNGVSCFSATNYYKQYPEGQPAPCNDPSSQGTFGSPFGSPYGPLKSGNPCGDGELPASAPACKAGASMLLTFNGNQADFNTVMPGVTSASLGDQWRPSDRWNVNASLRFENDNYGLANTNNPGTNFWFNAAQHEFCVNPVTRQPMFVPQPPQSIYLYQPLVAFDCPIDRSTGTAVQTVHPNGTDGILLTNVYPATYSLDYLEPRFSATYSMSADTVLRFSAGRYAQQPQNYEIQYNTLQPNLASTLLGFIPFGYSSPLHQAQAQFSDNYDLSWEQHLKNTDISFKITPYYRWATDQLYETVNLPSLGVSPSFNAGTLRVDGVEFALTKGDFDKNGISGVFSYTYTNASEMWNDFQNSTIGPVDQYIQDVQEFNALTKAGGGAPCYTKAANGTADPLCRPSSIRNPYYTMALQPTLAPHAWYTPGLDFPYVSPNTFSLVANYRHGKFAFTPAMSLQEGTTYGTPADVQGLDPRSCTNNQRSVGITTGDPLAADYTSCSHALTADGTSPGKLYIPDPQTGTFNTFGEFRQPWAFNLGAQLSYDVTPRIKASMLVANIVNACFGGSSEPWTAAYPPNGAICGYTSNTFYNGGHFYNGTSPNDLRANGVPENKYFSQSFVPSFGDPFSSNYPLALNMYFSVQVKL